MKKFISPKMRIINYEANAIMESSVVPTGETYTAGVHEGCTPIRYGIFYTDDDKQQSSIW